MSTKIAGPSSSRGAQGAWDAEGPQHVKGLRRAITAHIGTERVDSEVAPYLPGLLEGHSASPARAGGEAQLLVPELPSTQRPEVMNRNISAASVAIRRYHEGHAQRHGQPHPTLERLHEVVSEYVRMKGEILARVGDRDA